MSMVCERCCRSAKHPANAEFTRAVSLKWVAPPHAEPAEDDDSLAGAFKLTLCKLRSELIGEHSMGVTFGDEGGAVIVQAVVGRYARRLKPGLQVLRVDGAWPHSAAEVQQQLAMTLRPVTLMVGSSVEMVVKSLEQTARLVEPSSTASLSRVAQELGGTLEALEERFKSRSSLVRKVTQDLEVANRTQLDLFAAAGSDDDLGRLDDVEPPLSSAVAVAHSTSDALRYTVVLPFGGYVEGVRRLLATLAAAGFALLKQKNFWSEGDAYQGLNLVLDSGAPIGGAEATLRFEVQLHTPASFAMKMGLGHALYEEFRRAREPALKLAAWERALAAAATVPVPPGVLALPGLTTQPQPDEVRLHAELALFLAQSAEPHVSAQMRALFRPPLCALAGLAAVLKPPASSARKLQAACDAAERRGAPLSARRAAAALEDALRYTVLVEPARYAAQVEGALEQLGAAFAFLGSRNTWAVATDVLQGHYAYFCARAEGGRPVVFEVQFHTPASYALKEEHVDRLIAAMREEPSAAERARLAQRAVKLWLALPTPPGAKALAERPPALPPAAPGEAPAPLLRGH